MREYNNQDIKSNEAELDPCIAAEIRMKKALFSQRTRRSLFILLAIAVSLILVTLILVFLLSKSSRRTTTPPTNAPYESNPHSDYRDFVSSSPFITTQIIFTTSEITTARRNDEFPVLSPKIIEVRDDEFLQHSDNDSPSKEKEMMNDASFSDTFASTSSAVEEDEAKLLPVLVPTTSTTRSDNAMTTTLNPFTTKSVKVITPEVPDIAEDATEPSTLPSFVNNDDKNAQDCKSLLEQGNTESGIYQISLPDIGKFSVLCDMESDGGGWTVIQKRIDKAVYFANRTWSEYEDGFGDFQTSFWLGLKKIHALTEKEGGRPVTLRIELRGDFCEDKNGCSKLPNGYWWGEWDFKIGDASQKYALSISPAVAGNLSERTTTDRFHYMNNGKPFTTIDRDNDRFQGNCAQFRDFGGWWHNDCGYVALNGRFGDRSSKMRNMFWFYGSGTRPAINYYIKPRRSEMKIRSKS